MSGIGLGHAENIEWRVLHLWRQCGTLRWMNGVTMVDRIGNERIRGATKLGEISKEVQVRRYYFTGNEKRKRIMRVIE